MGSFFPGSLASCTFGPWRPGMWTEGRVALYPAPSLCSPRAGVGKLYQVPDGKYFKLCGPRDKIKDVI